MTRTTLTGSIALALLLTACGRQEPKANEASGNAMNAAQADAALDAAINANEAPVPANAIGTLVPPAPGEPGGLPDDHRPLDESAAKDPTSIPASGGTIERWGLALGEGRYGEAFRFWQGDGKASGMSETAFADAYRKYSEIHVLVGRPEATSKDQVRVPVQVYGRLRADGKPFNLLGSMTLARNPAGQRGETGQAAWLIAASDLKPRGTVRIAPPEAAADAQQGKLVPAAFRGRWAVSQAACARLGDDSRLTVAADSLIFYESQGRVRTVDPVSPGHIRVSAAYQGEGDDWTRTSLMTLSQAQDALTIDGMKRVRCLS